MSQIRNFQPFRLLALGVTELLDGLRSSDSVEDLIESYVEVLGRCLQTELSEHDQRGEILRECLYTLGRYGDPDGGFRDTTNRLVQLGLLLEACSPPESLWEELQQLEYEFLEYELDHKVEAREAVRGHYQKIVNGLKALDRAVLNKTAFLALIQRLRNEKDDMAREFDALRICRQEWTLRVALADELLREGLDYWLKGLDDLSDLVSAEVPPFSEKVGGPLKTLRKGNLAFLKLEALNL